MSEPQSAHTHSASSRIHEWWRRRHTEENNSENVYRTLVDGWFSAVSFFVCSFSRSAEHIVDSPNQPNALQHGEYMWRHAEWFGGTKHVTVSAIYSNMLRLCGAEQNKKWRSSPQNEMMNAKENVAFGTIFTLHTSRLIAAAAIRNETIIFHCKLFNFNVCMQLIRKLI